MLRACTLSPHLVPTPCRKRKMGRQKRKRPDQSSSSSSAPVLPVLPTGIDRYRLVTTTAPQRWRGHSCLRGAARAGRNACPTLPRSINAASCRDGFAPLRFRTFAVTSPALDDIRRQSTTADNRQNGTIPKTMSRPFRAAMSAIRIIPARQKFLPSCFPDSKTGCGNRIANEPARSSHPHTPLRLCASAYIHHSPPTPRQTSLLSCFPDSKTSRGNRIANEPAHPVPVADHQ